MIRYFFRSAVCIILCLPITVKAQSDADFIAVADEMYKFGDIKDAREIYKQAITLNPSNAYANYMVGKCYLLTINKEKSLPYLLKAYDLDPAIVFNILYLIGESYHLGYKFEQAIEYYKKYESKILNEQENERFKSKDEQKKIKRRIEECLNGADFLRKPVKVKIENMGSNVNSAFGDYAPIISADQTMFFFTSRREGSTGGNKANDNEYYEDIYMSRKDGDEWLPAQNVGTTINTNLHEASIGLSRDGKQLFIYKDDDKHSGDIFLCSVDEKGNWSKPKSVGKEINSEYIENSVTITPDGKTLYFSSNKPGGHGGVDIYMSTKMKNGQWGKAINLGDAINTEYDEEGPFIDEDGVTLFFSSTGHKGMGGFDLFKTVFNNSTQKWSEPVNLGYPINSTDDDIYIVMSGDQKYGYYASVKENGMGDVDLYRISFNVEETTKDKQSEAVLNPVLQPVLLEVSIFNKMNNLPLDAMIELSDSESTIIESRKAERGKFLYSFTNVSNNDFWITIEKDGFVYKKEKLKIPALNNQEQKLERNIYLESIEVGKRYILRNIYYDFNKATLKGASFAELDKLYKFLKDHPNIKIQIEGHTDFKGSDLYNKVLSHKRAESVTRYLVSKGISAKRILYKGFGESVPLATNDDEEEGRELNRRTEFRILN